ncbi:hypothetical protein [Ferruginibacter sp. SUN106]|uniref:hypothetical protein n=1 Tax=Ferruginibacter sp. SUN106 TaxID=2978348 RepID=UPI003D3631B1
MKYLFFILLFFINAFCFAQKQSSNEKFFVLKRHQITYPVSLNSSKVYFRNFKKDTLAKDFKELGPLKIYSISSTMYDIAFIVLLKENKFIASYAGCLQRTVSGGAYTIENDTLVIKSSKKIFNSILRNKNIDALKYYFIDIAATTYSINDSGLEYVNHAVLLADK